MRWHDFCLPTTQARLGSTAYTLLSDEHADFEELCDLVGPESRGPSEDESMPLSGEHDDVEEDLMEPEDSSDEEGEEEEEGEGEEE